MLLRSKTALDRWLLKSQKNKLPLAVVTGSSANGLSFSRSLGRRGIRTLLLDSRPGIGMSSRYGRSWVLPAAEKGEGEWLCFLEFLASLSEEKPIIFCTSDDHLLLLSRNRARIEKAYRFLIPDETTVENIVNKRLQYCTAEKAGIPIPRTVYPDSLADARSYASDFNYPCILKPYTYEGRQAIGKKAIMAGSPRELLEVFNRLSFTGQQFMVQEIIPGRRTSLFAYHGMWDSNGREIAWWTKRHLRGTEFGDGSYHITVDAPAVAELSRHLLAAYGYKGCSHVEFKLDARDQTYRLMEVNARTGMSTQQGIAAGIDLPWISYQYLIGRNVEDAMPSGFRRGVTFVNEAVDIDVFLKSRKNGKIAFMSWLCSFLMANSKAAWAWDDPGPFLAVAWGLAKTALRKTAALFSRSPKRAPEIQGENRAEHNDYSRCCRLQQMTSRMVASVDRIAKQHGQMKS